MRKLATILLLTAFSNSFFIYSYFSISLFKAKLEAQLCLAKANLNTGGDILKIPVSLLQKDESDEVWYAGNLYDVVDRDRINDTTFVFLLRDEQEQNVLAGNDRFFQCDGGPLAVGGHDLTAKRIAIHISDTENPPGYRLTVRQYEALSKPHPKANNSRLSVLSAETPSPPPKQA